METRYKRTKIVCTIGPACEDVDTIERMILAGMNVARLNFSHGSYEHHEMLIRNIREAAERTGEPVAIMQDLQGPKIRVGEMPEEGVVLETGTTGIFDTAIRTYTDGRIPVDWELLHQFVQPGERLLLNDGRMECSVTRVEGTAIHTTVTVGGQLTSHKGINVPDSTITVRAMTDKDKQDARFGVQQGVDFIALSFVMSPEDVRELRALINTYQQELGDTPEQAIHIITKIERGEAIERIDEILVEADAIMVARGDLGVELPGEQVPVLQKMLVQKALDAAKPVIVATQMLDSMTDNPRPTRAEVSDVANAVIDHTDAVMLSNESAVGKYPVETVETMAKILREIEGSGYDDLPLRTPTEPSSADDALSSLSRTLAEEVHAKAIVTASLEGTTARIVSRYRAELPQAVVTANERTARQLNLSWGVVPVAVEALGSVDDLVSAASEALIHRHLADVGDEVVVISGDALGRAGAEKRIELKMVT